MALLLLFLFYLIFFFITYKIYFYFKQRKNKNNQLLSTEMIYLSTRYRINILKIGIKKMINIISFANALIFSIVLIATIFIDNFFIRIIVMFLLLVTLIFIVYYFIGHHYRKKGMVSDV